MKSDQRNTSTLVLDEPEDARFVGTPSSTTLPQQPAQGLPLGNIVANTAGFALAFAAWVVFGPSVRFIAKEFHLSVQIATLIKTLPILSGAVMRIPLGVLSDRLGARLIFPALLITCGTGTYCASYANSGAQLIWLSLAIGVAGSTFIVGVQSVSSWTPKEQRGFALGLFGSGNVGTALTTFGLPLLLGAFGWRGSFRTYAVVLGMAAVVYFLVIRNVPQSGRAPSLAGSLAPLKTIRTWRFGLYYMATFGVFVATTLTVADIYIDGYHVSTKAAGLLATTFTFSASLIRGGRQTLRQIRRAIGHPRLAAHHYVSSAARGLLRAALCDRDSGIRWRTRDGHRVGRSLSLHSGLLPTVGWSGRRSSWGLGCAGGIFPSPIGRGGEVRYRFHLLPNPSPGRSCHRRRHRSIRDRQKPREIAKGHAGMGCLDARSVMPKRSLFSLQACKKGRGI